MMAISHGDISSDEDLGRRVLVRARIIAPCLDTLDPESEVGKDAISILKGVIAALPSAGFERAKSFSRNGTAMTWREIDAAFSNDARVSLQSLCGANSASGLPEGHFPKARPLARFWPEGEYS